MKRKKELTIWRVMPFLFPRFIIGFLCFTVIPMGASLFLSFTSYDLFTPPKWVGFDNYKAMLTDDEKYWGSLKVTFYYVLAGVPLRLAFALFIAVILKEPKRVWAFT